jgi:hypothetical protein
LHMVLAGRIFIESRGKSRGDVRREELRDDEVEL